MCLCVDSIDFNCICCIDFLFLQVIETHLYKSRPFYFKIVTQTSLSFDAGFSVNLNRVDTPTHTCLFEMHIAHVRIVCVCVFAN